MQKFSIMSILIKAKGTPNYQFYFRKVINRIIVLLSNLTTDYLGYKTKPVFFSLKEFAYTAFFDAVYITLNFTP